MKQYIVPAKDRLEKWKSFFEEVFRTDEHQEELVKVLVSLVMWLSTCDQIPDKEKNTPELIELVSKTIEFAGDLADTGMLDKDDIGHAATAAVEFATALFGYLKGSGVIQGPTVLRFTGFTGMDIIVKVLADGETEEPDEGVCLIG